MRKHPADLNPRLCSEECTYARAVDAGSAGVGLEQLPETQGERIEGCPDVLAQDASEEEPPNREVP